MNEARPRGPEEQGMVPQGPEDAAEDGDRGVQRRQVTKVACSEFGGCKLAWGKRKSAMKSGCMCVYSLLVIMKRVER